MRRIRREPARMKALLARRLREGLTWVQLSRESGVPRSTLEMWSRRLAARGETIEAEESFVRVDLEAPPGEAGDVEVVVGRGIRIRVRPGFDAEHLRRVVQALESLC